MGYAEYLKSTLRPLHIYDLDNGAGADELAAEGAALDDIFDCLNDAESNMLPQTADAAGLERLEELLPFAPVCSSLAERRAAVAALMFADGGCTLDAINRCLAGCGVEAVASETATPQKICVSIGQTDKLDEVKKRVEQIIPCHLEIEYGT